MTYGRTFCAVCKAYTVHYGEDNYTDHCIHHDSKLVKEVDDGCED